jgi:hypothetical protein
MKSLRFFYNNNFKNLQQDSSIKENTETYKTQTSEVKLQHTNSECCTVPTADCNTVRSVETSHFVLQSSGATWGKRITFISITVIFPRGKKGVLLKQC